MNFKIKIILDMAVIQMSKSAKSDVSDTLEFLEVSEIDDDLILFYFEGMETERNFADIKLTKRQAKRLANSILELVND